MIQWSQEAERYIDRSSLAPLHGKMAAEKISTDYGPSALTFGCSRREEFDITFMRRLVMAEPVKREPKKPYSKPTLTLYGTVRDLTQRVGTHGSSDGGSFPRFRTGV